MKKPFIILLSLIFVFALTSLSFAADKQVTGTVSAVDAAAKTLTVKGKKGDVTVSANDKTKVMKEEMKTLEDVKVGDKVTVKYQATDDKNLAKKVTVRTVSTKKEKEKAAAPGYKAP